MANIEELHINQWVYFIKNNNFDSQSGVYAGQVSAIGRHLVAVNDNLDRPNECTASEIFMTSHDAKREWLKMLHEKMTTIENWINIKQEELDNLDKMASETIEELR